MCHYVFYCVPATHMLINADLCLIMLIYNRATRVLLTDCGGGRRVGSIKRRSSRVALYHCFQDGSLKHFLFFFFLI